MPINNMEVPPSPAPEQPEMPISDTEVMPNDLEGGEDNVTASFPSPLIPDDPYAV